MLLGRAVVPILCLMVHAAASVHSFSTTSSGRLSPSRETPFGRRQQQQRHSVSLGRSPSPTTIHNSLRSSLLLLQSIPRGGASSSTSTALFSQQQQLWQTLDAAWTAHPYLAASIVCGIKALLADGVAQRRQQQQHTTNYYDPRRSLAFTMYGAGYQGLVQEFIYNTLYTRWFGAATTIRVVASKVIFDAVVHNACICIPMAYVVRALVMPTTTTSRSSIPQAIRSYLHDVRYRGLLLQYYSIWIPTNILLYTFIPPHWRITCMATVSFFWMILLSRTVSTSSPAVGSPKQPRRRQ